MRMRHSLVVIRIVVRDDDTYALGQSFCRAEVEGIG